MNTIQAIQKKTRLGEQKSQPTTNSRFYVRRWTVSKKEMEEVRQYIRKKRTTHHSKDTLPKNKIQEIKKRVIK